MSYRYPNPQQPDGVAGCPSCHRIVSHNLAHIVGDIHLTIADVLHSPILANVNVQPIRLVVHGAHAVGLEDTVFLGEVLLCKSLGACVSLSSCLVFLHS